MFSITAQNRESGKRLGSARKEGSIPGVVYGPKLQGTSVLVDAKEFGKLYEEAGETSLVSLKIGDQEFPVLIHEIQRDPLSGRVLHADFYQPPLDEEIEVAVPLVFKGEAAAVKDLGGTLLRNLHEVDVRALPQNLPHEIVVDISKLATFEDRIAVQNLAVPSEVKIMNDPEDLVAQAVPVEDVEEELATPVQENVERVERVEEKKKQEEQEEQ